MTTPHVGNAPTSEAPTTRASTLIDFRREARRRAIEEALASGHVCAFCFLRRFIARYPLFFEIPERAVFSSPDEIPGNVILSGSEGSADRDRRSFACAQDDIPGASFDGHICASNDADAPQEGRR